MCCQSSSFSNLDIGSPKLAGFAKQVEAGWDLIAGGADIWEKSDQFHFLHQQLSGDFDIAVRVECFTPAHLYSKAGLMIRETLHADSPHMMLLVFADNAPRNNNLGAYDGVAFKNIRATADPLRAELHGFDETHLVENVVFEGVVVNGKPISPAEVKTNAFVRNVDYRR